MDSPASSTPANPPRCACRVCGQAMEAKFQRGTARVADRFIVTCGNEACWMYEYTFTDSFYPSVDLGKYQPTVLIYSSK